MTTSICLSTPIFIPKSRTKTNILPIFCLKDRIFSPLCTLNSGHSQLQLRFLSRFDRKPHEFVVRNGGGEASEANAAADEVDEERGRSTLPERFRHLTKEAPDRPLRWPWLIALGFLVYAWRAVLWELTNWKKTVLTVAQFFGYLGKLAFASVYHYVGDLVTGLIRSIEFVLYSIRYFYASIVAFAPVPELTRIILFTSIVFAIAETTVPDSLNSQPYLLTLAGAVGFGAVSSFIPELIFWLLLFGFFCFSRYVKKRDLVSSALPSAAVLAAIGEPWVRGLVIALYLGIAILHYFNSSDKSTKRQVPVTGRKIPVPLLLVALSIGINLAAKWIRHRHLTWMIV